MICCCYQSVGSRVWSLTVGVEALRLQVQSGSVAFEYVPYLKRRWFLKQVRPVQSQRTYTLPILVSTVPLRSRPWLHVFLCCICPRSSARLWYEIGCGWQVEHCGCRNCCSGGAAWDMGCLEGWLLLESLCSRVSAKPWCGEGRVGPSHGKWATVCSCSGLVYQDSGLGCCMLTVELLTVELPTVCATSVHCNLTTAQSLCWQWALQVHLDHTPVLHSVSA